MFGLFKSKIKQLPWKENPSKYFKTAGKEELNAVTESFDNDDPKEVDYTTGIWGHAFNVQDHFENDTGLVHYGYGFYAGAGLIGVRRLKAGDTIIKDTEKKKKGIYLILHIEYVRDPDDMFWAYIVCIGHKD